MNGIEADGADQSACNRREFLGMLAAGGAGLALSSLLPPTALLARESPDAGIWKHHVVPIDKQLSAGWRRSLYERGEPESWRRSALATIGMPIGGIAAGQLFLCGDGTLGNWEIFNDHRYLGWGPENYARRSIEKDVTHGFALSIRSGGEQSLARLDASGFSEVRFRGEYPIGRVGYEDPTRPVRATLEAFSPFIPLNAKDSALPATMFQITVENVSGNPMTVGAVTWLENPVGRKGAVKGKAGTRVTRLERREDGAALIHGAVAPPPEAPDPKARPPILMHDFESGGFSGWTPEGEAFGAEPAKGIWPDQTPVRGFEGSRLLNSFSGGDKSTGSVMSMPFRIERKYINFLIGGGNKPGFVGIRLIVDGKGVRGSTGRNSETLDWEHWDVSEFEGKEATLRVFDKEKGGWGHTLVDQIEMADVPRASVVEPWELSQFPDFGELAIFALDGPMAERDLSKALELLDSDVPIRKADSGGDRYPLDKVRLYGLGTAEVQLPPGTRHTFTFVLAWHFPNTMRPSRECGHEYAARFPNVRAVVDYVVANRMRLAGETRAWRDTYYDSTLPYWLLDRLHFTASVLASGTAMWWKSGRFWAWEGVISCEGTCTHVWNYAQTMAHLFPELERNVRERQDFSAAFHDDGLVGFRSDDGYAADGQCGTILKAWREHRLSADGAFLTRNWTSIRKALDYCIRQDANEDGLIEDRQPNTYDIDFFGANTFVGSLYLSALRAGEQMAIEMGDTVYAKDLREIYRKGERLSARRLWNGEYFIQEVDLKDHPKDQYGEGCLSDQLFGQNWAHLTGLGHVYPQDKVRKALESIWKYNWTTDVGAYNKEHPTKRAYAVGAEAGLLTCTWPKSEYLTEGVAYKEEVWTGIEYEVAATMIREGMVEEGLSICRAVHERYHPEKRNPYNEVECGDFYARSMASWGVFLALSGYTHHGPKGHLGFGPRVTPEDFRCAFTTAEGWGSFSQRLDGAAARWEIRVVSGALRLNSLEFDHLPRRVRGRASLQLASGGAIAGEVERGRSGVRIEFPQAVLVSGGDAIVVDFA